MKTFTETYTNKDTSVPDGLGIWFGKDFLNFVYSVRITSSLVITVPPRNSTMMFGNPSDGWEGERSMSENWERIPMTLPMNWKIGKRKMNNTRKGSHATSFSSSFLQRRLRVVLGNGLDEKSSHHIPCFLWFLS